MADSILSEQHQGLEELRDLLQLEREALLAREVDGEELNRLAAAKQQALQTLEALEQARREAQGDAAADERAQVDELARRCAQLNEINGSLIQRRLLHNQRFLSQLRHLAGNPLYGADGQTHKDGGRVQVKA